jgi:nucleoside-diphosphate-sugar epimerase
VRAFVTGGTGFIGGHLVRKLRERGDEVVALVRSPENAGALEALGCDLVPGALDATDSIEAGVKGADAVFHGAAMYEVGIRRRERPAMYEANVTGAQRVLDTAIAAGVPRIVHISTVNVFGNTKGEVVDETYVRDPNDGFLSAYDETKYLAHQIALDRIAQGAPILIAQPGGVYGPGDPSQLGIAIRQISSGQLRLKAFPKTGFVFLHVEDAAEGLLRVHDKGQIGEAYVLGGTRTTLGELIDLVARLSGRKPPRITIPAPLVKAGIPFGPLVGKVLGTGPNLRELIRAADGVTYWASDEKARQELGYSSRDLESGLRQTLAAGA